MKIHLFIPSFIFLASYLYRVSCLEERATSPPRGWNSYDSFCWTVSEEAFLSNAEIISKQLLPHGYEYVVVDYLWYRKKVPGAYVDSLGFDVIDKWGRMIPDPDRWPSSRNGKGFTEVAKRVHSMGLKFGIHVMRGISRQAYDANSRILDITKGGAYSESGRYWHAKDIGMIERSCVWMKNGFMSVDTKSGAGRAFLKSLYQQYADWGVDFVKHDCVFGEDLDLDEITYVSEVLKMLDRPIVYSLSPGTSVAPAVAKRVSGLVNMYRITGDDWDTWGDVAGHFDVSRDFANANMIGTTGLLGKSWPDLDMLPLGWLTDQGSNEGPHRTCKLSLHEQRAQMTLWAMAKSPLMFGGDVRNIDETTYKLITHPTVLEINSFSSNNKELPYVTGSKYTVSTSVATSQGLRRYPREDDTSESLVLGLTSCSAPISNGWSVEAYNPDTKQICWKENFEGHKPVCLYQKKPPLATDEEMIFGREKLHRFASNAMDLCLDGSPRTKVTAKEFKMKRLSFSPCRWHANQVWKLNGNGTVINSYSGLCATVNSVKANPAPTGVRAWVATGPRGQIYVAFFNLNPDKTVVSANIADLAKALPGRNLDNAICRGTEVWSGKSFGSTSRSISMAVEIHGSALFVLNCH